MTSPQIIDLGRGQPDPRLLPLRLLQEASAEGLAAIEPSNLQYGPIEGQTALLEALSGFLEPDYGGPIAQDQLFITAGSSHGLDLTLGRLSKPGDSILVEEPSYFYAKEIIAARHLVPVPVPTGPSGLDLDALEATAKDSQAKLLYTIPTHHNPATMTLSELQRARLIALAQAHQLTVIADEVYQQLGYERAPPLPLAGRPNVVSLGSFSKILAPGLRLGWIIASPEHRQALGLCGVRRSGGGVSPFTSAVVAQAIRSGALHTYLRETKRTYHTRLQVLLSALERALPELDVAHRPDGGFFVWGALPESVQTTPLLERAKKEFGVAYRPGPLFSWTGRLKSHLRVSFTYYDESELEAGVARLAKAVRAP